MNPGTFTPVAQSRVLRVRFANRLGINVPSSVDGSMALADQWAGPKSELGMGRKTAGWEPTTECGGEGCLRDLKRRTKNGDMSLCPTFFQLSVPGVSLRGHSEEIGGSEFAWGLLGGVAASDLPSLLCNLQIKSSP